MKTIRSGLGYFWAFLAVPVVLATFIGMNFWAEKLAYGTGVKISPWFSGGEVVRTIPHPGYQTAIHRPVFDGLIADRAEGFVQLRWKPEKDRQLPPELSEAVDYDGDGKVEFEIQFRTRDNRAVLVARDPRVMNVENVYDLGRDRAVRVRLRNTREQ